MVLACFSSRSPVSIAILNFFINNFSVWVSPTPTPRKKLSIYVPVDCIPVNKSRLEAGKSNCPPWAAQKGSSLSVFIYFIHWVRRHFVPPCQDTQIRQVFFIGLLLLIVEFYLGLGPVIDPLLVVMVDYVDVL